MVGGVLLVPAAADEGHPLADDQAFEHPVADEVGLGEDAPLVEGHADAPCAPGLVEERGFIRVEIDGVEGHGLLSEA
jgi:hypothetical protein